MSLILSECHSAMSLLTENSVDSIVTDPPYELGFMGKSWDNAGIAYSVEMWSEALRILKPGGHLLAFGGTRTYHRMACAIEDAGFEIRDSIHWVYGSGFPKSHNISKAIDKAAGVERKVVGQRFYGMSQTAMKPDKGWNANSMGSVLDVTASATPEAQQWEGWGTALKPAHEPIVLARKPLISTVAANVLEHGTGALNIDASRIEGSMDGVWGTSNATIDHEGRSFNSSNNPDYRSEKHSAGRWPANVIFDEDAGAELDAQSGGASRFFYCAKASKAERNAGLDALPVVKAGAMAGNLVSGQRLAGNGTPIQTPERQNFHPTVKPLALMRYLVRLVTPPGGVVFDQFLGSGTTAVASILEGFKWAGCEMTEDYWPIIQARIDAADMAIKEEQLDRGFNLFSLLKEDS